MNFLLYISLGLIAGMFGGLLGIGGGSILIPALVYLLGFTQHQAQGTTLAIMIPPIGLLAAWRYWQSGNVKIGITSLICLGFFIGGWFGAMLANSLPELYLKKGFGIFLLVVAIKMILGK
jgi:uncharacterized protein